MTNRPIPRLAILAFALLSACIAGPASAQSPVSGRFLSKEDILLYGIGLRVEPSHQTVPRDIATIVSTFLQAPNTPVGLPPFAPDAEVRATLRGPSLATPRELVARPNQPFEIPPLTVAGIHTLDNIRLVSQGQVLLRGTPESVSIDVIDKLLVTQVTARPLTAAEIREKGIVFDKSNFQAYNFSAAFAIEDRKIQLDFPVLLPTLQGAQDVAVGQADIPAIAAPQLKTLQTIIPDTLRLQTQIPNLSVVGFTLSVPELEGQDFFVPPIPGVIVIPGDIGFLNQFFSVMLMVGNVAPAGSNLVVGNLSAEIVLPPGYDNVVGSPDDPLAMARTAAGETPRIKVIVQPGPDGNLGTPDDITTIGPGETGNAEYLVEGRREGSHVVEMEITGTLYGLPVGPVQVRGRAAGAVLVRNPTFTLTFTHPEVVNAGEPYTLDVTVTNTGESPANFVSVTLYPRNVSGATITGDPTRQIESILPGDSASVTFDLVSLRTGKVTAATLDSNENVSGRFALKTAVGELGIPLSPDSLVLPKEANSLPQDLRTAAIGLLGKAWAVATAPGAALPASVKRFSRQIVLARAVEVAEAGFRVTLHEEAPASASQLLMDFAGSHYSRIEELFGTTAAEFTRDNFAGFDQLRRTSVRGDVFAAAVTGMLAPDLAAKGSQAFHFELEQRWSYRAPHLSVIASTTGGTLPYSLAVIDPAGLATGGVGDAGKVIKQIPYSDSLRFGDSAAPGTELVVLASPDPGEYVVRLVRRDGVADAPFTLSAALPDAAGNLQQIVFNVPAGGLPSWTSPADAPYRLRFEVVATDGSAASGPATPAAVNIIPDPAPTMVGVVQQRDADVLRCEPSDPGIPIGRVIAVLFSEEVTTASAQDKLTGDAVTNYTVDGNKVVGVALQPGRRIAFLALRDPVGPFIDRQLTASNVQDRRGQPMQAASLPIEMTIGDEGGVVSGRVMQADGQTVPFADVRLFYLFGCDDPRWVGISAKSADAQGHYSYDFVTRLLRDRITAVNMEQQSDFRHVPFTVARNGQRLNVDVVFLGRGTFEGRTVDESGAALPETDLRVTSLTDQSQYGVKTDGQGRFSIARIPVGNIFVEAVNPAKHAQVNVSDYIPFAGAIVTRDVMLLDVAQSEITIRRGAITGHVLRADGSTPAAGVPVMVFYEHLSQPGVLCPGAPPPPECAVEMQNTGADGAFSFPHVVAGRLHVQSFDQAELSQGDVRFELAENQAHAFAVLLSGGLATVRGLVLDPSGAPVAGARVGGGLSLTTTNDQGQFTLTDVPAGSRQIVAVSDTLGSRGQTTIDIVRAGEIVNATIVLESNGSVAGVVYRPDGTTPAAGASVYLFKLIKGPEGSGIQVVGTATTDANGGYRIDRVPVGEYSVSSFNSSFTEGNILPVKLKFFNQVFKADLRYRGGGGSVHGVVFDDDGRTPLKARVAISGEQLVVAQGRVGVEFKYVQYFRVADTDFTTGRFSVGGLWVGGFTLSAVGQFSPDPVNVEGTIPQPGADVELNLRLQSTSQIAGIVYLPDGVTPAPANVIVRYKSDAVKVICKEDSITGEESCDTIPQGIQEETVLTGDDGRFWFPVVNAGNFTLSIEDPATGRVGTVRGAVRAGERAEMSARLLGLGELTVQVFGSDGTTIIPGAKVVAEQLGGLKRTFFADTTGTVQFRGGDAFPEGDVILTATDTRNGFTGRASARIERDGQQLQIKVYLYDAVGVVYGTVWRSDGLTPVPYAEVVIANSAGPLAIGVTGADGTFRQEQIPLGDFTVHVFEAASARQGFAAGRIDAPAQEVPANVTELAIGMVKGTIFQGGALNPLKGWTVQLSQQVPGLSLPSLQTTTSVDGTFAFPGTSKGSFSLLARKDGINGSAHGSGAIDREGQIVDVPMVANIIRQLFGRVQGTIVSPTGAPASNSLVAVCQEDNCRNATAGADGGFFVDEVPLGRWEVRARSQTSQDSGSSIAELLVDGDVSDVTVVLVGLSQISGRVEYNNGAAVRGANLVLEGVPSAGCQGLACRRSADENGAFTFSAVAAQTFTVTAVDPISGLKGSVGGSINSGEQKVVRIVVDASARVSGRVMKANGTPASAVVAELSLNNGERALYVASKTDGTFAFDGVPLVPYVLTLQDPIGDGLARRSGQLQGDLALGDVVLDEAPPIVVSMDPAKDATAVPLNQALRLTFSEPIMPGGVTAASVVLIGPAGPVTSTLDVSDADRVVTVRPVSPLKDEARYTLRVSGITDRLDKAMVSDYVAAFTTVDITPPTVLDMSPAQNTGGVTVYSPVRLRYSEPIAPTSFRAPPFELRDGAGTLVPGRLDYLFGNTVVVFTPGLPLLEDATYRVRLGAAVDLAGNEQAQGIDYTFTTTDRTPPQIASLTAANGGQVIENALARVSADVGATHDVAIVDFYINGVLAYADRAEPFELVFQATPQYGVPGSVIQISAIPTDTSGNRGTALSTPVTVLADDVPAVHITAPASGLAYTNGARVTVTVQGSDDLGVAKLAYRALTGRAQDAASRTISPAATSRTESFGFNVPLDAPPGSIIEIQATAVDTKGQTTTATPVRISVVDAVAPTVAITGATTGAKVNPGQPTTVVLTAQDAGGIASLTFTAAGAASFTDTRAVNPPLNSVATSFTFPVPPNAQPGQTVTLDAVAVDSAGNQASAARVILPVADGNRPTVRLRTENGATGAVPGRAVNVIVDADDEIAVTRIDLSGQGAFAYSDARQITPPSGSASVTFAVPVPQNATPGSVLTLAATALDSSGNTSITATLLLTITQLVDVTLPPSSLIVAGEVAHVDVTLGTAAPAGGTRVDFTSTNAAVASVEPYIVFAEGEMNRTVEVTGNSGGTATIAALIQGVDRASMTASVRGGVVRGVIYDAMLNPVPNVDVTVVGGNVAVATITDNNGGYFVEGIYGPDVQVRALDSVTRLRGYQDGTMALPNGWVQLNVILLPAGRVMGTVFQPDRTTAVGPGTRVDIFDAQNRYNALATAFTDASGAYEFPLVEVGPYVVVASDTSGNRGETTVSVTATGEDRNAPIVFLGRGSVVGTVRDGSGNPVPNAQLQFSSNSIFGWGSPTVANAQPDGTFRFDNVFVGDFSIVAHHPVTAQAGTAAGRITTHAQTVVADIQLASFGSVQGTVYRSDGTTAVAGAEVTVNDFYRTTADDQGHYAFQVLPLGSQVVVARESSTNGVGTASGQLTTSGDSRTIDVRFVPQGTLIVTVVDAGGAPIGGAAVNGSGGSGVTASSSYGRTDAQGVVVLPHLTAGTVRVSATSGALSGSATTTLAADQTQPITVQLEPTGSVRGFVFEPDGQTPAAGHVTIFSGYFYQNVDLAPDGSFQLDGLRLATYTVRAYDAQNRYRAVLGDVTIAGNGQIAEASLTLIGMGTVTGRVIDLNGASQPDMSVQLRSGNSEFGGTKSATTNAAGYWTIANVPVGGFTLSSGDGSRGLLGTGTGSVTTDGQTVTIDIVLQSNAVNMPRTLRDANAFSFDMRADGAIDTGYNSGYVGTTDYNQRGASVLDLFDVNGNAYRFAGSPIGTLEDAGREIAVREEGLAGLNVTRKLYVPLDGYFARYLEELSNPTTSAITVDMQVTSRVRGTSVYTCYWWYGCWWTEYPPVLVSTSSGDTAFSIDDPSNPDRWIVLDDNTDSDPFLNYTAFAARGFAFDGPGAPAPASVVALNGVDPQAVSYRWNTVTVPPGGSVTFMHFLVQQTSRSAANASMERLVQMPPEVLTGLAETELATIQNFAVPPDGSSSVAPLETLTATVTGRVFEGNGVTPVENATVTFRSHHPLFGRTYDFTSGADGRFSLEADLANEYAPRVIPAAPFTIKARHPITSLSSADVQGQFASGTASVDQPILIPSGLVTGTVRRHTGVAVDSGNVQFQGPYSGSTPIGVDGRFGARGLPAGVYTLTAYVSHPQGTASQGTASATIVVGQTTIANVTLDPTGVIQGTLRLANGAPSPGAYVYLQRNGFNRSVSTDSGGQFRFDDVPAGAFDLYAYESRTYIPTHVPVTVTQDATTTADILLVGVGSVTVQVNRASGAAVSGSQVRLQTVNGDLYQNTDVNGRTTFASVVTGAFTASASLPSLSSINGSVSGTLGGEGQSASVTVTLPAVGSFTGVVKSAADVTFANVIVSLISSDPNVSTRTAYTNATGVFRFDGVKEGTYTLSVADGYVGIMGRTTTAIAQDDEVVQADIIVRTDVVRMPMNLYDGNNFRFDLYSDGAVSDGSSDAYDGGLYLTIRNPLTGGTSAFTGTGMAIVEDGGREIALEGNRPLAGLQVTRKIYVPANGYAARYLEILHNAGSAPVTVDVEIASNLGSDGSTRTIATSSGDVLLTTIDSWIVTDDDSGSNPYPYSDPTLAHVFEGPGARQPLSAAVRSSDNLYYDWNGITVNPGGTAIVMHFASQQRNQAAASAAAQRLVQLPPEAIAGLSVDEIGAIVNFAVPADGSSALTLLTSNGGAISGRVLAGDSVTPVPGAAVRFTSANPIFATTQTRTSDAAGTFSFPAVALDAFTLIATHPQSGVQTSPVSGSFPADATTASVDVVFLGTGTIRGVVRTNAGTPVSGGTVSLSSGINTTIAADGTYAFSGLPAGSYTLTATVPQPSGSLVAQASVTLAGGQTVDQDLVLPAIGTVIGSVLRLTTAVTGAQVVVTGSNVYRSTVTDATGAFRFDGLPIGVMTVSATDPQNGTVTSVAVQVFDGAVSQADVVLAPTGTIHGRVLNPDGTPAQVTLQTLNGPGTSLTTATAADGTYTLSYVPLDAPLTVRAQRPGFSNMVYRDAPAIVTTSEPDATVDFTMQAIATVRVHVRNAAGEAVAGVSVEFRRWYQSWQYTGSSDVLGDLDIPNVPEGEFFARANGSAYGPARGEVTSANHGQVIELTVGPPLSGTVQGHIYAGDGTTPAAQAYVVFYDRATGSYLTALYADGNGYYSASITVGSAGFRVLAYDSSGNHSAFVYDAFSTAGETRQVDVILPVTVIRGTVRFADGTPVPYPNVVAQAIDNTCGECGPYLRTFYAQSTDAAGGYAILGVPIGAVTVVAQTGNGLLSASVDAELIDAGIPLVVDVSLPAAGQVQGVVTHADGSIAAGATVRLSQGTATLTATADATGQFLFPQVPAGALSLQACETGSMLCTTLNATLADITTPLIVNIRLPVAGSIQGTLVASDGTTPIPGSTVSLQNDNDLSLSASADTDAQGRFTFSALPSGNFHVFAGYGSAAAVAGALVLPGRTTDVLLTQGTGASFTYTLSGTDTFRYDVACSGYLSDGGTTTGSLYDAYDGAYQFYVAGWESLCTSLGSRVRAQEILIGPAGLMTPTGTYLTSRKVYVPPGGGYARYLDTVTNLSGAAATIDLAVESNLGSDSSTRVAVAPSATGNTYAVTFDNYSSDPALAHVFSGSAPPVAVSTVNVVDGSDHVRYSWSVTLQPGQTMSLLHFAVQRQPNDTAGAQAQAQALVGLTDPHALDGLSADELGSIINFSVAGAAARTRGSVAGRVLAADGSAVAGSAVFAIDAVTQRIVATATSSETGDYAFASLYASAAGVRFVAISGLLSGERTEILTLPDQALTGIDITIQ